MLIPYLKTFFDEKNLPPVAWDEDDFEDVLDSNEHNIVHIDNLAVIEYIGNASKAEQKRIATVIRTIDMANGDVNDYLKHLAKAIVVPESVTFNV